MPRETFVIDLTPEQPDSRTIGIVTGSVRTLAQEQSKPYIRQIASEAAGLGDVDFPYPPVAGDMPLDQQIGVYSEFGTLKDGFIKYIWYERQDEAQDHGHIEPDDEEGSPVGQVDFAIQEDESYFYGNIRVYPEGIILTTTGFEVLSDDDRDNRFTLFAARLGLESLWQRAHDRAGAPTETVFNGLPNKLVLLRISQSLKLQAEKD